MAIDIAIPDAWERWEPGAGEESYLQLQLAQALGRPDTVPQLVETSADLIPDPSAGPSADPTAGSTAGSSGQEDGPLLSLSPSQDTSDVVPVDVDTSAQDAVVLEADEPESALGTRDGALVLLPTAETLKTAEEQAHLERMEQAGLILEDFPRRVAITFLRAFDKVDSGTAKSVSDQAARYVKEDRGGKDTQLLIVIDVGLGSAPGEPHIVSLAAYDPGPRDVPAESARLIRRLAFCDFEFFHLNHDLEVGSDAFFQPVNDAIESILAVLADELSDRGDVLRPALFSTDHALGNDVNSIRDLFLTWPESRAVLPALTLTESEREELGPESEDQPSSREDAALR